MSVSECLDCGSGFAAFRWRYNCQACGHGPVCKKCCSNVMPAFHAASETHRDPSSKSGPAQICKSCFKKFGDEAARGKQSERVINEIFQTEQSYCQNLRLVDDIYARHFGQDIAQSPKPKSKAANASMSPCSATLMFTAWHQLTTLHEDFLHGLSAIMKNKGNIQTSPTSSEAKTEATVSSPPPRDKPLVPSMSIHVCLVPTPKGEIGCRFMPLGTGVAGAIAALAGHCIALLVEHITPRLPAATCREMQVGDIVVAANGQPFSSTEQALEVIAQSQQKRSAIHLHLRRPVAKCKASSVTRIALEDTLRVNVFGGSEPRNVLRNRVALRAGADGLLGMDLDGRTWTVYMKGQDQPQNKRSSFAQKGKQCQSCYTFTKKLSRVECKHCGVADDWGPPIYADEALVRHEIETPVVSGFFGPSVAKASGGVREGDVLVAVNHRDTTTLSFKKTMALLRRASGRAAVEESLKSSSRGRLESGEISSPVASIRKSSSTRQKRRKYAAPPPCTVLDFLRVQAEEFGLPPPPPPRGNTSPRATTSKSFSVWQSLRSLIVSTPTTTDHERVEETTEKKDTVSLNHFRFETAVRKAFLNFTPYLKLYSSYVAHYRAVNEAVLQRVSRPSASPSFRKKIGKFFSKKSPDTPLTDSINMIVRLAAEASADLATLPSILILPVQRICRYSLLLKELRKNLPPLCKAYAEFADTIDTLDRVALKVDQSIAEKQIQSLVSRLPTTPQYRNLVDQMCHRKTRFMKTDTLWVFPQVAGGVMQESLCLWGVQLVVTNRMLLMVMAGQSAALPVTDQVSASSAHAICCTKPKAPGPAEDVGVVAKMSVAGPNGFKASPLPQEQLPWASGSPDDQPRKQLFAFTLTAALPSDFMYDLHSGWLMMFIGVGKGRCEWRRMYVRVKRQQETEGGDSSTKLKRVHLLSFSNPFAVVPHAEIIVGGEGSKATVKHTRNDDEPKSSEPECLIKVQTGAGVWKCGIEGTGEMLTQAEDLWLRVLSMSGCSVESKTWCPPAATTDSDWVPSWIQDPVQHRALNASPLPSVPLSSFVCVTNSKAEHSSWLLALEKAAVADGRI